MDNINMFHNQKIVVAETVGFWFEADFLNQYRLPFISVLVDNFETFHNENMVAADTICFRFDADLFKPVPMILGYGCHG